MYVYRNIQVRSCSHCCSGKAKIITYSECEFVALGIQYAMRISGFGGLEPLVPKFAGSNPAEAVRFLRGK